MFSAIRIRMSYANVTATLALFFAMSGGALAASHYLVTSTKQIKPSVLAQLKGKAGAGGAAGATGPAGSAGSQGPAGTKGETGANGANGTNGQGVETSSFVGVKGACLAGGLEVKSASPTVSVCNGREGKQGAKGEEGSPWTAGGTLPEGQSEKGTWSNIFIATAAGQAATSGISFGIPLKAEPEVHFIKPDVQSAAGTGDVASGSNKIEHVLTTSGEFNVGATITGAGIPTETTITEIESEGRLGDTFHISNEATETQVGEALTAGLPPGCKGSAAAPEAEHGNLCVFAQSEGQRVTNYLFEGRVPVRVFSASPYGAIVASGSTEAGEVLASGTWAVAG